MFSLPYMTQVQKKQLRYPVEVWYDKPRGQERIEYNDGMQTYVWRLNEDKAYESVPHKDHLVCQEFLPGIGPMLLRSDVPVAASHGSVAEDDPRYARLPLPGWSFQAHKAALRAQHAERLQAAGIASTLTDDDDDDEYDLTNVLPDLTGWKYNGTTTINKISVNSWQFIEAAYDRVNVYTFYATIRDNKPVQLHLMGYNFVGGSHFDEYVFDFVSYEPGPPPRDAFEPPKACSDVKTRSTSTGIAKGLVRVALSLSSMLPVPPTHRGLFATYDAHAASHGRRFSSQIEYVLRAQVFGLNRDYIDRTNDKPDAPYQLAANKWIDYSEEEFRAFLLPDSMPGAKRVQHGKNLDALTLAQRDRVLSDFTTVAPALPAVLDWRGTGAVSPIKDQATCGSCWAYGATSAVEAAYYMQTGRGVSLSEQQLSDCAWDTGNEGCDGGLQDMALVYLMALSPARGLMDEDAYPYTGQDMYCSEKASDGNVRVRGYGYVKPECADCLKSAVYFKGPVTISIDANPPDFRFYSSGIYYSPDCGNTQADLDHAVTLVGYVPDAHRSGHVGWIVKNSWSTYWGDAGYIIITSFNNTCGVATQPVYAEVYGL